MQGRRGSATRRWDKGMTEVAMYSAEKEERCKAGPGCLHGCFGNGLLLFTIDVEIAEG